MKKMMFFLSMLYTVGLLAQQQSIVVEVSPDNVLMQNEFEISFTIENAEIRSFEAPAFKEFDLLAGPMTSSMMQIINGQTSSKQTYTYILAPKNPGKYYIEPAFANLKDGTVLETQPIEINVKSNPEGIKQERKQRNGGFNDFFSTPIKPKATQPAKPERKTYKL
ncbi:MAG TPA: BatD family protein [Saprospiraceae bacterium]|nr:BatD family protein [Saprospiraceae bacterium]HMX86599.1 BatD family protein [Saprospiraceae bacterium]HMZ74466.1 BatD family protein [Saprospiraceae bacterium]HNA42439.1 BatD family protein [Saprospiraceae bacterium]HNA93696.1 BatD family protein [Saprospiraceae bacterium]